MARALTTALLILCLSGCQMGQPRQLGEQAAEASLVALCGFVGFAFGGPWGGAAGAAFGELWLESADAHLALDKEQTRSDDLTVSLFKGRSEEDVQKYLRSQATDAAQPLVLKGMALLVSLYALNHLQRWYRRKKRNTS